MSGVETAPKNEGTILAEERTGLALQRTVNNKATSPADPIFAGDIPFRYSFSTLTQNL